MECLPDGGCALFRRAIKLNFPRRPVILVPDYAWFYYCNVILFLLAFCFDSIVCKLPWAWLIAVESRGINLHHLHHCSFLG